MQIVLSKSAIVKIYPQITIKVYINILRLAVFEFLYCEDIPPKVTLNEAVDLGKTFGSENSGSFINGILDALNLKLNKKNATNLLDRKSRPSQT